MGRGFPTVEREGLPIDELLDRARLTESAVTRAITPTQVARAIRAELWHGTLEGARLQARLGAASLLSCGEAWKSPALLYLGFGTTPLQQECALKAAVIEAECAARLAEAQSAPAEEWTLAATQIVELGEVLGPLVRLGVSEVERLAAEAFEVAQAIARVGIEAQEPGVGLVARTAQRLAGWLELPHGGAGDALVMTYNAPARISRWDEYPSLELIALVELPASAESSVDRSTLLGLPPALRNQRWWNPA